MTTSRLMKQSDDPESSSAKGVVLHKTVGRNSNGIDARGSGTIHSTKEEALSHASVESWSAEFLSVNATAEVRS